ncbi:MAG: type II toxin-antitoxin system PemK/MazF family toxin [Lachnospiraceae bacterium]|nr:type II toxin-antitoxin system PemK/MazF family toxin [Lachnospiraceae bacterium]
MEKTYLRGEMYYANLEQGVGSEQNGHRPVVIIQNNVGNKYSPTVIVAAISAKVGAKAKLPTHYYINAEDGLEQPSIILLEQLRTIDKRRLENYIGQLSPKHIEGLNHALAISIDLVDMLPNALIMCLCPACARNFADTGNYFLQRINPQQKEKETCTYCNRRAGYDFAVIRKK